MAIRPSAEKYFEALFSALPLMTKEEELES